MDFNLPIGNQNQPQLADVIAERFQEQFDNQDQVPADINETMSPFQVFPGPDMIPSNQNLPEQPNANANHNQHQIQIQQQVAHVINPNMGNLQSFPHSYMFLDRISDKENVPPRNQTNAINNHQNTTDFNSPRLSYRPRL